jgi:transcriptional regulator with XRE-family HTH domain
MDRKQRFEMLFGFIEAERIKKGMTKHELCKAAGISESTYSRALNGLNIMDVSLYYSLVDALEIGFIYENGKIIAK